MNTTEKTFDRFNMTASARSRRRIAIRVANQCCASQRKLNKRLNAPGATKSIDVLRNIGAIKISKFAVNMPDAFERVPV